MNTVTSQAERDFLIAGARTYLDVDEAMEEFRRQIQKQSRRVVMGRIGDLKRVCEQDWSASDVRPHSESGGGFVEFGYRLAVKELGPTYGGLYFCLKLSREGDPCLAVAFLYREKKTLAGSLWDCFTAEASGSDTRFEGSSISDWNIFFARHLSEDNLAEFGGYLDQAIVDLVAFIESSGGLQKHLGQGAL